MKYWHQFTWTDHALQRIAEYKFRLCDVFEWFEESVEVKKSRRELLKEFVKHGGIKGMNSAKIYAHKRIAFVVRYLGERALIITVIDTNKYKKEFERKSSFTVQVVNGKMKLVPTVQKILLDAQPAQGEEKGVQV